MNRGIHAGCPAAAMILLLVLFVVLLFTEFFLVDRPQLKGGKVITIERGMGYAEIEDLLEKNGVVRFPLLFRTAVYLTGNTRSLKAGRYSFSDEENFLQLLNKLRKGEVLLEKVTVPEGLTMWETAEVFAERDLAGRDSVLRAASNTNLIEDIDERAMNLEGYLFPDTYAFGAGVEGEEIVETMVRRFRQVFGSSMMKRADMIGLTVREAVVLASLIEKETAVAAERYDISAVFHNRLRKGMLLQCDPTVIYALRLEGLYDGDIRKKDLKIDSPYNTYVYPGLPPGPIANPGRDSLEAALNPSDVSYLYFVSRNDGTHHFSTTLREHSRAVRKYQKQYWRRKWYGKH